LSEQRVTGVELDDATTLEARAVVSTLNPEQTALQLLSPGAIAPELREGAQNYEWEKWSLFVANWGVLGAPPRYAGYPEVVDRSLITVMGYETHDDVLAHIREVEQGDFSPIAGHGTVASMHDPLMAPHHVTFGTPHTLPWESWAPYDAPLGPGKGVVREQGAQLLERLCAEPQAGQPSRVRRLVAQRYRSAARGRNSGRNCSGYPAELRAISPGTGRVTRTITQQNPTRSGLALCGEA
jgi:hypothetical protein